MANSASEFEYEVQSSDEGHRLDVILTAALQTVNKFSRSKVSQFIAQGFVRINDEVVIKAAYQPDCGDIIYVSLPAPVGENIKPDDSVQLNIVYEDADVLVLNKDAGVIVHPGVGGEAHTLAHGLVNYLGESIFAVGHPQRPGIVHRLDKDTSGLMVVAKSVAAYHGLIEQFLPPRTIKRNYLAVTLKLPDSHKMTQAQSGTIDLPIARHTYQRTKMTAQQGSGKAAITHWKVARYFERGYLLELQLETGRTHQIRAHLEALNAPIVGDSLYGFSVGVHMSPTLAQKLQKFTRVALHAWRLEFIHPITKNVLSFEATLPEDIAELIETLS